MTANGQTVAATPLDTVRDRLDDPQVAAALNTLLDHADVLAVLVSGLDGLVRRGDVIADSMSATITEFRGAAPGAIPGADTLKAVDLQSLAASLATLSGAMVSATPALSTLLSSKLTDPAAAEVLAQLGDALVEGQSGADRPPKGLYGLFKAAKDPDVVRGLGFLLQVAKSFGRRVGR
ncbi:DUF1641 domain-containing protein [Mycobacterium sp. CVI_P3]|uniref:DUF1641 domain-containing protein n=1 Tax=Mycobacterium pinniadriaticum TaxID=2994102 RepID=A0ABT3SBD6_9MYCO|nr:DUF1641 domain-containing protein [Mycobacterium pinniadriaticum]MCX2930397.1 DUF1641 domain-containing protein [Mycobacterium pinniadriaticum]MCX2936821.1 DUF1641 domain-containing protein [Mycobacterium pinniadriaticum]